MRREDEVEKREADDLDLMMEDASSKDLHILRARQDEKSEHAAEGNRRIILS